MKRILTVWAALLLTLSLFAQVPEKMSYQAVVRDGNNKLLSNQAVGIRISILKDSVSGIVVYQEIYNPNPSTNTNGLVTIEIGGGTPVIGIFSAINWSLGTYFITTETDPEGGTNYTISGTSQLLSVPYALYAKTAESIGGSPIHYVGELFGGGVVFWTDHTGQHGLICSAITLSNNQVWSNVDNTLIGPSAQSGWDGLSNSNAIVAQPGHTSSAAKLCLDYTNADYGTGSFSDWYLPSFEELWKLSNVVYDVNKALLFDGNPATPEFFPELFMCSSEADAYLTLLIAVGNGMIYTCAKSQIGYTIRAIRAF